MGQELTPQTWHMVQCRMLLDFRNMPPDMILAEEIEYVGKTFSQWLDDRYGDGNVDLCYTTYEGTFVEEIDELPEGWGLSEAELMELLPGETESEKKEYIERAMRHSGLIDEDGQWTGSD